MKVVFPYFEKNGQHYPVADITLRGKKESMTVKALVDSGASFSVFRAEIAEYLAIPVEKGEPLYLEGIGGRILGYLHRVPAAVGGKKFDCLVVFSREFLVSFNIVGRNNFFSQFLITFDEKNKRLILG